MTKAQLARRMVLASLLGSSAAPMAGPNNRANAHVSQDTNGQDDEYECESSGGSMALAPWRWLHGAHIPCSSPTDIHTHNHLVSPSHQNAAQLNFTMIERLFDVVVVPLAALSSARANQLSSFHSTRALALN
eukprot:CAMPEP_0198133220 /NCGR_PEP_ID=MMETSP1442-20131203/59452_1 /TAXON_ID= /ORGANISM="Craspedostauros australis, Strain CCMP3328" /LENGTH=131 /DNA_ID=CAMNT_0043794331 /DNA_START=1114 /DNA_END=1509 /DNA_ORIENTATION=-